MAMGRAGPIEPLVSPFANVAPFDGTTFLSSPQPVQNEGVVDFQRPCTRGQLGSAAVVSYVDLDRGLLPTSGNDSGEPSGAEAFSGAPSGKEKKKVGRPITYKGDVNSAHLTEAERRRIKRRVANRESARRVRQKRQETMEEMQARMDAMQRQTAALTARLHEVEQHKAILVGQLSSMRDQWSVAVNENMRLADEAGRSPHETTSGHSSGTNADLSLPNVSCMPASPAGPPPAPFSMPPASMYGAFGGGGPAAAGAVTSGQPGGLRIPSVTSSTQISGFRPGVTITSAVRYTKQQQQPQQQPHQQQHSTSPPPTFTVPTAPPAGHVPAPPAPQSISLAPSASSMYLQVPQAPTPLSSNDSIKAEVPQMPPSQQQQPHMVPAPIALKDTPSVKHEPLDWEWFLGQTGLEPLLDPTDPNLLKGF